MRTAWPLSRYDENPFWPGRSLTWTESFADSGHGLYEDKYETMLPMAMCSSWRDGHLKSQSWSKDDPCYFARFDWDAFMVRRRMDDIHHQIEEHDAERGIWEDDEDYDHDVDLNVPGHGAHRPVLKAWEDWPHA
jgi:hypothetical protein